MRCRRFSTLRFLLRLSLLFFSVSWVIVSMFLFVWGVHFVLRLRLSGVIVSMYLFLCGRFFFGRR